VVGVPVTQALANLAEAGITNVDVVAAEEGRPGFVVDVEPNEGASISSNEPVTLFVGPLRGNEGDGGNKGGGNGKGKGGGDD
jgi:beta-lactam-binding protein with PASTA domain